MSQESLFAQRRLFDRVGMSQHGVEHVHLSGECCRGFSKCSARAEQRLCFVAGAIEDD